MARTASRTGRRRARGSRREPAGQGPGTRDDVTPNFAATVRIRGINPYVLVDARRAAALRPNGRRPLPVLVRINGTPRYPWRTNLMPVGDGRYYLYLHGPARKASKTGPGDRVQVEIRFDARYRSGPQHPVPAWFRAALSSHPRVRQNWTSLSPSRKKEVLRYFAHLKSFEARSRNLQRALRVLSGERGRFLGREWVGGT